MNYVPVTTALDIEDLVLAQATSSVSNETLRRVGHLTGGLVLTDRPGIAKMHQLQLGGFSQPLVLDLIGVDWRGTQAGSHARREAWRRAVDAGDADLLLTPSRRIAAGDEAALVSQLKEARALLGGETSGTSPRAWVGLGLDGGWLSSDDHLPVLVRHVEELGSPVALAFASTHDPINTKDRVRALRQLVQVVDMALMRSDLAALGAWAYGARFASIGFSSTVRHLPIPMPNARNSGDTTPHVLMPKQLAWVRASALYYAGDHPTFRCSCATCQHRSLARLGDLSPGRREEARLHSFHTWNDIAHRLQGARRDDRELAWQRLCKSALDAEQELARDLGGRGVSLPFRWQPLHEWLSWPIR